MSFITQENDGEDASSGRRYPRIRKSKSRHFYVRAVLAFILVFVANCTFAASDLSDNDQKQAALRALMGKDPAPAESVKGIALSPWAHGASSTAPLWVGSALVQRSTEDGDAGLWPGVLTPDGPAVRPLARYRSARVAPSPQL